LETIKRREIIVINDDQFQLDLVEEIFKPENVTTTLFSNPQMALDYILNNNDLDKNDLILTDSTIMDMDCVTLGKQIKMQKPFLPICVIGSFEEYEQRSELIDSGIFDSIYDKREALPNGKWLDIMRC